MTTPSFSIINSNGTTSASDLASIKAAGVDAMVIQAQWSGLDGGSIGTVSSSAMTSFKNYFDAVTGAGLNVIIEHCIHNPPSWVQSSIEPFTDQNGNNQGGAAGSNNGSNVRNWMWTQTGRNAVSGFISAFATSMGSSRIAAVERVKFGGGIYGELQYNINGTSFYGFGSSMQNGSGLGSGLVGCPVPGYHPLSGNTSSDLLWLNWYIDGIVNWMLYFAQVLKNAGYTCHLHYMCPSSGLAVDAGLDQYQYSQGTDYTRMIGASKRDPQLWPWCTWINGAPGGTGSDSGQAAWQRLWGDAAARGKHTYISGENTGGEGNTTPNGGGSSSMQGIFQNAMSKTTPPNGRPYVTGSAPPAWTSYNHLMWLNWGAMTSGGADLNYYGQQIAARKSQG
jgi:hypothetical protein